MLTYRESWCAWIFRQGGQAYFLFVLNDAMIFRAEISVFAHLKGSWRGASAPLDCAPSLDPPHEAVNLEQDSSNLIGGA